jgi:hypothetical protein
MLWRRLVLMDISDRCEIKKNKKKKKMRQQTQLFPKKSCIKQNAVCIFFCSSNPHHNMCVPS